MRPRLHEFVLLAGTIVVCVCFVSTASNAQGPAGAMQPSGNPAIAGMEVLTRGPIHEAYAEPVNTGAVRPLVVPKKPPDAIEEVPPDMKPADAGAIWIGGYWSWDDERQDFVWVSGVWRVPPPGQRWIAGYWTEVPGGYSWAAGIWAPAGEEEVSYYPPAPATEERGPTSDSPSPDSVWITGCWRWNSDRYAWQPGYWAKAEPGWIWEPASYSWSPRGWIFRDGYWDYPLDRRGLIFAPVYFTNAASRQPNFFFSPSVVIQSDLLTFFLFVRPSYAHYYFGDYFAANYDGLGIYPWFSVGRHAGYAYDPLFTHYNWLNSRSDPKWATNLQGWHEYYRAHPDQRPAHDLAAQQRLAATAGNRPDRGFLAVAETLQSLRNRPNPLIPLVAVSANEKTTLLQKARLVRQSGAERLKMETAGTIGAGQGKSPANALTNLKAPQRLRLPKVAGTFAETAPNTPLVGAKPPTGRFDGVRETLKPVVPPTQPGQAEGVPLIHKPLIPPGTPPGRGEATHQEPRRDAERPRPPEPAPAHAEGKDAQPKKHHDSH